MRRDSSAAMARGGDREFDVVVYGATGFTGARVAAECAAQAAACAAEGAASAPTVCLAGRDAARLQALAGALPDPVAGVAVADVADTAALDALCARARVVVSCVGPYRLWGEPVVAACVRAGTDYVDISGEPEFIERMELAYGQAARDAGCLIVSACGFDSVPCDLGTLLTAREVRERAGPGGAPAGVEAYITIGTDDGRSVVGHFPTWQCAVMGFGASGELRALRKRARGALPVPVIAGPKMGVRRGWHQRAELPGRHAYPFPGSDASIIKRTMAYLGAHPADAEQGFKPVHAAVYLTVSSAWYKFLFSCYGLLFGLLASKKWGRNLLLRYPALFSYGAFTEMGPTDDDIDHTTVRVDFFGTGYSTAPNAGAPPGPPDVKVHCQLNGPEPGYALCSRVCAAAAMTLVDDDERTRAMPAGGVLTAAAAFGRTGLMERCAKRGVTFEVLE